MNDPYQTPNLTPLGQDFAEQPPKAIKVFGVIHLIFGILSILGLIPQPSHREQAMAYTL